MNNKLDVDLTSIKRKMVGEFCECINERKYLWDWCPHCIQEWKQKEHEWYAASLCDTRMELLKQTRELLHSLENEYLDPTEYHNLWSDKEKRVLRDSMDVMDDKRKLLEKEAEILEAARSGKLTITQLKEAVDKLEA